MSEVERSRMHCAAATRAYRASRACMRHSPIEFANAFFRNHSCKLPLTDCVSWSILLLMGTLSFVRRHSTLIAFTVSLGASTVFVACGSDSNNPGTDSGAGGSEEAGGASSGGGGAGGAAAGGAGGTGGAGARGGGWHAAGGPC